MLGKWNHINDVSHPSLYGDSTTYELSEEWLKGLSIEDWGCGTGGMRLFHTFDYKGIDGSAGTYVDLVKDLREYTSKCEGLFMRHVLEHNYDWKKILTNALSSFTKRMALVLFTPLKDTTQELIYHKSFECPDLAFSKKDLLKEFGHYLKQEKMVHTSKGYGVEYIFFLEK